MIMCDICFFQSHNEDVACLVTAVSEPESSLSVLITVNLAQTLSVCYFFKNLLIRFIVTIIIVIL